MSFNGAPNAWPVLVTLRSICGGPTEKPAVKNWYDTETEVQVTTRPNGTSSKGYNQLKQSVILALKHSLGFPPSDSQIY